MKTLRLIGAAFLVLLGAMTLVAWSVAGRAVGAIESGDAAENLTQKILNDPDFADAAAQRITDGLVERTEGRGIQRLIVAFEPEIQTIIVRVLTSDRLEEAATKSVGKVEDQLVAELTQPDRPSAPFTISIDLSDRVNQRIDEIPVVGPFIPAVTVPPVERELIPADTFDDIRSIYGYTKAVATWGIFIGIALIIAGFFAAPRSRWYWAQAGLLVFFVIFAVSVAVRFLVPSALARALPGGETGGSGTFLTDFVTENSIGPIAARLLGISLLALALAVIFGVIARFLPTKPDAVVEEPVIVEDAVALVPAGIVVSEATAEAATSKAATSKAEPVAVVDGAAVDDTVVDVAAVDVPVVDVPVVDEVAEPEPEVSLEAEPEPEVSAPKPAAKRAAPKAAAKTAATKATPTRATPAKATPAKATPAKATPAPKATTASDAAKPKTTRARKPTPPKE